MTRAQKRLILLTLDLAFVPIAFAAAFIVQNSAVRPSELLMQNWPLIPLLVVVAFALSVSLGTSEIRLKQYDIAAAQVTALFSVLLAVSSGALAAMGKLDIPLGYHVVFGLVFFALSTSSRILLLYVLLAIYRKSAAITRVLIYGAGRSGMALASSLRNRADIVPIAFIDDNVTLRGLVVAGLPVFSGVHINKVLERHRVDQVVLAMPSLSVHKQNFLFRRLEKLGLEVLALPAFAQLDGNQDLVEKLTPMHLGSFLKRPQLFDEMATGSEAYRSANVMITGAGGSIGLELCRQVVTCAPRKLVLFEMSELALYNAEMEMQVLTENTEVEVVSVLGSVVDGVQVEHSLRQHDISVVLHAAAYKHVPLVEFNARSGVQNNTIGTATVAQKAKECGVGRFVLVSSDKAVRPVNVMGASKRLAELIVQDLATRSPETHFSIVRFGNVLGSSGSVIPLFQDQITRGGPVTVTDENVTRFFMTVQEAARLVLTAGSLSEGGEVFVLDMGKPLAIKELARQLIEASGYTVRDAENPDGDIEIVTTRLRPGEKLHEELMIRKGAQMTAHPKIIHVRESCLSELEMAAAMRDLNDAIEADDDEMLRATLVRWIAEYRPVLALDADQDKLSTNRHRSPVDLLN